ncbi:MAG: thymidine phosphorylase [Gammaproteobacteria bacterium]|nr:thymidine phosphorylase [Gammaproteobacteria bacterium]
MLIQEIIAKKRDGLVLTDGQIGCMVQGIHSGEVSDSQLGAFAMAVFMRGMSMPERVSLTQHMMHSGRVLRWQDMQLDGPVVDKHSTGGVGDKISLILAPIVAACGAYVPMISGRGLGHTGGTLDKLESLEGYNPYPNETQFKRLVQEVGCAIIGQTDDLAPADRRFYATRDVTATVESIDLITASILSKKLAAGLDGLVMDVKTGNGAFAAEYDMAYALAQSISQVAEGAGVPSHCLITDMNQVLGHSVGNAVEVQECIDCLMNPKQAEPRMRQLTLQLAAHMLQIGGIGSDIDSSFALAEQALFSGRAAEVFARMCREMGVHGAILQTDVFAAMPVNAPVLATHSGYVNAMDTHMIGMAMVAIGAGRRVATDQIDHGLGLTQVVPIGAYVEAGQPLAMAHTRNQEQQHVLQKALQQSLLVSEQQPVDNPIVYETIMAGGHPQ